MHPKTKAKLLMEEHKMLAKEADKRQDWELAKIHWQLAQVNAESFA